MTPRSEENESASNPPFAQRGNGLYPQPEYFDGPPIPTFIPEPVVQEKKTKSSPALGLVLAVALISGGLGGGVAWIATDRASGNNPSISSTIVTNTEYQTSSLSKIVAAKSPSVVTVSVEAGQDAGTGSGVVITSSGYIVTNAHVVTLEGESASTTLSIETSSGKKMSAKLVAYDTTADIAVIKVSASAGLKPIKFANSDAAKVGDPVIAIGSPLGLDGTVTSGILSHLNRPISVQSAAVGSTSSSTVSLISLQTDAAINEGNSGGALLDSNGDLLGINDSIATSGSSSGSIGIGFSIPSNYVKRIAMELINTGSAKHALLDIAVYDGTSSGATVSEVATQGAGAKGGIEKGDRIVSFNGIQIEAANQLIGLVKQEVPGTKVTLGVVRGGVTQKITLSLGG